MPRTAVGWTLVLAAQAALAQARYQDGDWRELWRRIEQGIEVQSLLRVPPARGALPTAPRPALRTSPMPPMPQEPVGSRRESVRQIACQLGLDPALALALIEQESGFQHPVRGQAGELGAAQILPSTAQRLGYDPQRLEQDFLYNVRAGLAILRGLLEETGDEAEALRAYNGGRGWRGLAPEARQAVQSYAAQVLARKSRYAGSGCTDTARPNP
jgi:soluble lytic murein transglycosylase-like protein